jgi:hypothetical protein
MSHEEQGHLLRNGREGGLSNVSVYVNGRNWDDTVSNVLSHAVNLLIYSLITSVT